jgi:hypothetical protein
VPRGGLSGGIKILGGRRALRFGGGGGGRGVG